VIHERDGQTDAQTDRHCVTAKTALASHRAVKITIYIIEFVKVMSKVLSVLFHPTLCTFNAYAVGL